MSISAFLFWIRRWLRLRLFNDCFSYHQQRHRRLYAFLFDLFVCIIYIYIAIQKRWWIIHKEYAAYNYCCFDVVAVCYCVITAFEENAIILMCLLLFVCCFFAEMMTTRRVDKIRTCPNALRCSSPLTK